jgi:hypothetical protein
MPRLITVTKKHDDVSPDSQPSVPISIAGEPAPRPQGVRPDPLGWRLGGATPVQPRPGPGHGDRGKQGQQRPHANVDARRRRNPSSRFRG